MSDQMNCGGFHSVTSSLVSEVGLTLCKLLHGRLLSESGQGVARANLSARQAKERDF